MEPVLIGVLLDVSGSMEQNVGDGVDTEDSEWARSIFTVVDNLIKNDLKPNNHIFAIGFGASREADPIIFDLLGSLKDPKKEETNSLWETVNEFLNILESNGAYNVRKWASKETLMDALKGQKYKCDRILQRLQRDRDFVKFVVDDCLPPCCRDCDERDVKRAAGGAAAIGAIPTSLLTLGAISNPIGICAAAVGAVAMFGMSYKLNKAPEEFIGSANGINNMYSSTVTTVVTAKKKDIDEVVEKIEKKMNVLTPVSDESVFEARVAHRILRGHVRDERELTKKRINEMMDDVRPYVYGGTPMNEALHRSAELFSRYNYRDHKKLLFILSDGIPTDRPCSPNFPDGITTVSCFITSSNMIDPFVLYSSATNTQRLKDGAKFMFHLSSTMLTQNIPRTIFVNRKWTIEMDNNETQLFLQVNHPDHLNHACDFARKVITSQEALSDVLSSVDLDVYINQSNDAFSPRDQEEGPTCYAHASATVMHLAMNRILGRHGGCPDFDSLRDEMINCYSQQPGGERGADTEVVLEQMCPKYRLRCKKVDKNGAMQAIMEKRPVVARFRLTQKEWSNFKRFFLYDGKDILTSADVKEERKTDEKTTGHAVVLTSFNSKCLRFMNSWGTEWGDDGFFNVKDTSDLDFEYFDIYWDEGDLSPNEKIYYAAHGSEVANKLMKNLIGLQESTFECPLCSKISKVTEFKGSLSSVSCPKCKDTFKCGTKGNILALNLYLISLSDKDLKIRNDAVSNSNESVSDGPNKPGEC